MRFGVSSPRVSAPFRGTLFSLLLLVGCAAPDGDARIGSRTQAVCNPMNGGGDLMCACTDNAQCTGFDNDTRLIICDVLSGMMVGLCSDCLASSPRAEGCACSQDADCGTGLNCNNGRTCQRLRARSEFCIFDSDCGSDMMGAMTCLPTKSWCGPLENDFPCDFNADCLTGNCSGLGVCSSGAIGSMCATDADCASLICSQVTFQCVDRQPDGIQCTRNLECINRCNSFSGVCSQGAEDELCTTSNPDGDCMMGLECTDCGGGVFQCQPPGGPCD